MSLTFFREHSSRSKVTLSTNFPETHTQLNSPQQLTRLLFVIIMISINIKSSYGFIVIFLVTLACLGPVNGDEALKSIPGCSRFPWHVKEFKVCYNVFQENYRIFRTASLTQVRYYSYFQHLYFNIFVPFLNRPVATWTFIEIAF